MQRGRVAASLAFLLVAVVGCAPSSRTRVSVSPPADWPKQTSDIADVSSDIYMVPQPASDDFHEVLHLVTEQVPATLTLDAYAGASVDTIKTQTSDFELVSEDDVKLGDLPAKRIVYQCKMDGQSLTVLAFITVQDATGAILTATMTDASFDQFEPTMTEIAQTLKYTTE